MKHVTTPETARKLKAAGFPQPKFELGQFWYDSDGSPWVVVIKKNTDNNVSKDDLVVRELVSGRWEYVDEISGFVFAPTATDILEHLGSNFLIKPCAIDASVFEFINVFECLKDLPSHKNANPAEAAALALLDKIN